MKADRTEGGAGDRRGVHGPGPAEGGDRDRQGPMGGPDMGRRGYRDMDRTIVERLGNLLSVKSLVTLTLTVVFACMAAGGTVSQDFMTVYAVVIAFYFGTQSQRARGTQEGGDDDAG